MCGINAIISDTGDITQAIQSMVLSLYHRGPDAQNISVDNRAGVALGHNRLAILDLSVNGIQPMETANGEYAIVYNGEVYNYLKLRKELVDKGYHFKSNTDTEVILYGYQEWGNEIFAKLNGMWGLVIYDKRKQKIIVSRDRVGIKPVYYYQNDSTLVISSEIKAILRSKFVKPDVNLNGLNEYFSFQNIISNDTLFKDVYMLEAGHNMEYDLATKKTTFTQYWDMDYEHVEEINVDDFCAEVLDTFSQATRDSLLSDVPIGASISGGMDSSSILAITSQQIPNINTFTGYFDQSRIDSSDRSINERDDARIMANEFSTQHHERLINATNVIDTLPAIVWHLEDPKVGMCYTFYLLNQAISQHVTVNLSGTGGDETFGGYPWRYGLIKDAANYDEFCDIYYKYWCRLIQDDQKGSFFTQNALKGMDLGIPRQAFQNVTDRRKDISSINRAIYFEFKTFLHGMLMVEDKMGMAFSIETRFPFLDNDMVALTSRIPDSFKYKDNEAKLLLKKAFEPLLPKEIIYKRKQGFTPPDMSWYRKDLQHYIRQLLFGPRSMVTEYINADFIEKTLKDHNEGADNRLLIWGMMFFEGWLRTFIAGNGSQIRHF